MKKADMRLVGWNDVHEKRNIVRTLNFFWSLEFLKNIIKKTECTIIFVSIQNFFPPLFEYKVYGFSPTRKRGFLQSNTSQQFSTWQSVSALDKNNSVQIFAVSTAAQKTFRLVVRISVRKIAISKWWSCSLP